MNQHQPGKSTTGMMLFSLLRVQDTIIFPKWYEDTTKLCFNCPEDGDLHVPSQLTCQPFLFMGGSTRIDIIAHMLMGCMLVLPESNTFYFTTKTASCQYIFLGKRLQECVAAIPIKALIDLLPYSSKSFGKYQYRNCIFKLINKDNDTKCFGKTGRPI